MRRRILAAAMIASLGAFAAVAIADVASLGARLGEGRPAWLILAAVLEVVSALGFVATFVGVFGEWLAERTRLRFGLVVRAATIVLPAGGLLAIAAGAGTLRRRGMPRAKGSCRTIAFLLVTNAPNAIVLGIVGLALGTGLLHGPHAASLTTLPGAIALAAIALTMLLPVLIHRRAALAPHGRVRRASSMLIAQLELGVLEARELVRGRDWKLLGALAYYAADNAVLWTTFKAFGHTHPPIATLVMAYLIGSAAGSLPVPGGIGVVEGGMIGLLVLYGAPTICAGIAVLAYRAISSGLPLALGGGALLTLRSSSRRRPRMTAHA
jgi:uncharacterized membrane protein YbhN (UPF0104 family)